MAEPRRFLDVWIVETNTVYRQVPYTVVSDWVQQGRLLESDMLRPAGAGPWVRLGTLPAFAAYLPKAQPYRSEDRAEALEPVELEMAWKHPREDEEGDVDMIPLIDVSLVLLVFFMMTATVAAGAVGFLLPPAYNGSQVASLDVWIGIIPNKEGTPVYMLGEAARGPKPEDQNLSQEEVLKRLDERLVGGQVANVTVQADRTLRFDVIKQLTIKLEERKFRGKIQKTYTGVTARTD